MEGYSGLLEAFHVLNEKKRWDKKGLSKTEKDRWRVMRCQIEEALFQRPRDPAKDTREFLRVPATLQVVYRGNIIRKESLISVLGEGGLQIGTLEPEVEGTRLEMEIVSSADRAPIHVRGEVVWAKRTGNPEDVGMGIRFLQLTDLQKRYIYTLVDEILERSLLERRKFPRIDARVGVRLWMPKETVLLYTEDLSLGGMFVSTTQPPPVGQEIKFELVLPSNLTSVSGTAKVVRAVRKAKPFKSEGFASQFLFVNLTPNDKQNLKRYMCLRLTGDLPPSEKDRRKYARLKKRIKVRFQADNFIGTADVRDISGGGVFIQTREAPPEGSSIVITLVDSANLKNLTIEGRIVRVVPVNSQDPRLAPGIGVAFQKMSAKERRLLEKLLKEFVLFDESSDTLPHQQ